MTTVTLAEAKANLEELVDQLAPGETIVIVKDNRPVAEISPARPVDEPRKRPRLGTLQGLITIVNDDDEHLEGFEEYVG